MLKIVAEESPCLAIQIGHLQVYSTLNNLKSQRMPSEALVFGGATRLRGIRLRNSSTRGSNSASLSEFAKCVCGIRLRLFVVK